MYRDINKQLKYFMWNQLRAFDDLKSLCVPWLGKRWFYLVE